MTRREAVETFTVIDPNGTKLRAKRVTIFEAGRLIDGGEMPTSTRTELPDGTLLTGMLGDNEFFDRSTGTLYKRG